jgi:outer membrane protein OmpA-like peptidoglycan-associated protein
VASTIATKYLCLANWKTAPGLSPNNPAIHLTQNFLMYFFSLSPDGGTALVYGIQKSSLKDKEPGLSMMYKQGTSWSKPIPLEIEDFYNNSKHIYAYLTADASTLLMSLERDEGNGQLDLYVSFLDRKSGKWSKPKNLGKTINTMGSEESPFLAYDNKSLYYASDVHGGVGKLDLFVSRRLDESWTKWSEPINLGKGINSEFDENGIWLTAMADSAIIVSADTTIKRKGLYQVCLKKEFRPGTYKIFAGKIVDSKGKLIKIPAEIEILQNGKTESIWRSRPMTSDYVYILPGSGKRKIKVNLKEYEELVFDYVDDETTEIIRRDLTLMKVADTGMSNLGIQLFFDYKSSEVRIDEIEKLKSELLKLDRNSSYAINIFGHADTAGSDGYNKRLSNSRAESVKIILQKIVNEEEYKIKYKFKEIKGFGESQAEGKSDSQNRRVDIMISEN